MKISIIRVTAIASLALTSALGSTAELVGQPPFTTESWGVESDRNSGPAYIQTFLAPTSAVLEEIKWWGFHGSDSAGSSADNLVVALDGIVQTGSLSVVALSDAIYEYTLDVPDAVLSSSALSVVNDSDDVVWFWQSAPAIGNPGAPSAYLVSFSLRGHIGTVPPNDVPEPSLLAMLLLSLAITGCRLRQRAP